VAIKLTFVVFGSTGVFGVSWLYDNSLRGDSVGRYSNTRAVCSCYCSLYVMQQYNMMEVATPSPRHRM